VSDVVPELLALCAERKRLHRELLALADRHTAERRAKRAEIEAVNERILAAKLRGEHCGDQAFGEKAARLLRDLEDPEI
jgi:hypothetical protein